MGNNTISKIYYPVKANPKGTTDLKVELYYSLGGTNYFTYKQAARGYYLSVTPVTREGCMESYTAFTGYKRCVHPVKRRSKSAEIAAQKAAQDIETAMIGVILNENGLELF